MTFQTCQMHVWNKSEVASIQMNLSFFHSSDDVVAQPVEHNLRSWVQTHVWTLFQFHIPTKCVVHSSKGGSLLRWLAWPNPVFWPVARFLDNFFSQRASRASQISLCAMSFYSGWPLWQAGKTTYFYFTRTTPTHLSAR